MSFQIDSIALYGPVEEPRVIALRPGELNVITGYSKTGKSSLIAIVHYCLGADECGVAYGDIRSTVEWYAVRLIVADQHIFVARRAPEPGRDSSTGAYFQVATKVPLPLKSALSVTTNIDAVIQLVSRAAGIVDNAVESRSGAGRPHFSATIKHALAFCFQPQDEIISRRYLFFQQGEPFVRQAIQDTLPYFLGAVDDDHVVKLGRLRRLRQEHRQVLQRLAEREALLGEGTRRAAGLVSEAVDLGLVKAPKASLSLDQLHILLRQVADRGLAEPHPDDTAESSTEYNRLLDHREALSAQLRRSEADLQGARALIADRTGYVSEGTEQVSRLKSLELLPATADSHHRCPLCASEMPNHPTSDDLRLSLVGLERQLVSVKQDNPHLERLVAQLEEQVGGFRRGLLETRSDIEALDRSRRQVAQYRDFIARAAHVRGRISIYLEAAPQIAEGRDDLAVRAGALARQIADLERDLDPAAVDERLDSIAAVVSRHMTAAGQQLGLEHSDDGLRFLPKRLAVVADTAHGPIPMDKMGSGENWVGYHLAVILALHEFFIATNRPVPRFIFIDQPSQVSFPADRDHDGRLEVPAVGRPVDRERAAVLQMFELIRDVVARSDGRLQVILMEHADPDVDWFDKAVIERWRGKALIPDEWLER